MTFLLIMHIFMGGQSTQKPVAIFADEEQCRVVGAIYSGFLEQNNTINARVDFSCKQR